MKQIDVVIVQPRYSRREKQWIDGILREQMFSFTKDAWFGKKDCTHDELTSINPGWSYPKIAED